MLYWMTSCRRTSYNFALERSVWWARELKRPLVVLEALRVDYPWASDRLHTFVMQGMRDNADALDGRPVTYYPYVEPTPGAGKGLLRALSRDACVVITDDFPAFFLPRMLEAAARQVSVMLEAVDSNGVLPLTATDRDYPTAYAFRRFVHAYLAEHGVPMPAKNPLARRALPSLGRVPPDVAKRWPRAKLDDLERVIRSLPIDHDVPAVALEGGSRAGRRRLRAFLRDGLAAYAEHRNDPDADATSGLSPYLHFGHIASHQVVDGIIRSGAWNPDDVEVGARGSRSGWGGRQGAGEFLDQIVTWRELGYNMCVHRADYDRYESLPDWARRTLAAHADDPRDPTYTLDEFANADTHDELWNAAQRQLRDTGVMHNYLRMLWGKKILEWTPSPRDALAVMIELNNRYALDGRNPNSYAGIFWILGRYDRAWGPERPVFGKVRYMSSANTRRKLDVADYLATFGS